MAFTGLKVISVDERPKLQPGGRLDRVVVIVIRTDLGNTGQLEMPVSEYEALSDDELGQRIGTKAALLDRAHTL